MLASEKRLRVMTECLIKLQEISLQSQKVCSFLAFENVFNNIYFQNYSETSLPALRTKQALMKDVENLMNEIKCAPESPEDIVHFVYGACYVMSVDPDTNQTVWQPAQSTAPSILSLLLTYKKNALVKKVYEMKQHLFKKVYT